MKTFGEVFGAYIPEMTRQLAEGTIERLQIRTAQRELIALLRFRRCWRTAPCWLLRRC